MHRDHKPECRNLDNKRRGLRAKRRQVHKANNQDMQHRLEEQHEEKGWTK